jgi:hypothetical protein
VSPENAAQASASGQETPGAAGFFGGVLPRAAYQAASVSLRAAMPDRVAEPVPSSFQVSGGFCVRARG